LPHYLKQLRLPAPLPLQAILSSHALVFITPDRPDKLDPKSLRPGRHPGDAY